VTPRIVVALVALSLSTGGVWATAAYHAYLVALCFVVAFLASVFELATAIDDADSND
jgi:hypothetical protein